MKTFCHILLIIYLLYYIIYSRLITKQTPPGGIPVSKVMVAEAIDITRYVRLKCNWKVDKKVYLGKLTSAL